MELSMASDQSTDNRSTILHSNPIAENTAKESEVCILKKNHPAVSIAVQSKIMKT